MNPPQTNRIPESIPSQLPVEQKAARPPVPSVPIGNRGLQITDLDSLWQFSNKVAQSGLAPKGIETPAAIFVILELGLELGMPPMMALQNICCINGRPGVFGDVPLALVRNSGLLEAFSEEEIGKPGDDTWGFKASCKRVGCLAKHSIFTVADAKRAGLWGKDIWAKYPKRMLMFRARGYLLRDEFGDVLKGVRTQEDLLEIAARERERNIPMPAIDVGGGQEDDAQAGEATLGWPVSAGPPSQPTKRRGRPPKATISGIGAPSEQAQASSSALASPPALPEAQDHEARPPAPVATPAPTQAPTDERSALLTLISQTEGVTEESFLRWAIAIGGAAETAKTVKDVTVGFLRTCLRTWPSIVKAIKGEAEETQSTEQLPLQ